MITTALQMIEMKTLSLSHSGLERFELDVDNSVAAFDAKGNVGFKLYPLNEETMGAALQGIFKTVPNFYFAVQLRFVFEFQYPGSHLKSEHFCAFRYPLQHWEVLVEQDRQMILGNATMMSYSTCRGAIWSTLNGKGPLIPAVDLTPQLEGYFTDDPHYKALFQGVGAEEQE